MKGSFDGSVGACLSSLRTTPFHPRLPVCPVSCPFLVGGVVVVVVVVAAAAAFPPSFPYREESSFVEAALQPRSVEKSADGFAAGRLEVRAQQRESEGERGREEGTVVEKKTL